MTTPNVMLVELDYTTAPTGIASFQRDYNRFATRPVLVTGTLDEATKDALAFAHGALVAFKDLREHLRRGGGDA